MAKSFLYLRPRINGGLQYDKISWFSGTGKATACQEVGQLVTGDGNGYELGRSRCRYQPPVLCRVRYLKMLCHTNSLVSSDGFVIRSAACSVTSQVFRHASCLSYLQRTLV